MHEETGEIRAIDKLTPEQKSSGKWATIERRPNPGCKRCHGRGWIGKDVNTGKVIKCRCVKKRPIKKEVGA